MVSTVLCFTLRRCATSATDAGGGATGSLSASVFRAESRIGGQAASGTPARKVGVFRAQREAQPGGTVRRGGPDWASRRGANMSEHQPEPALPCSRSAGGLVETQSSDFLLQSQSLVRPTPHDPWHSACHRSWSGIWLLGATRTNTKASTPPRPRRKRASVRYTVGNHLSRSRP